MQNTIVITGCSAGFGHQLAEKLARQGHRVFATMRGVKGKNAQIAQQLHELARQESLDLHVIELDVCSATSVAAAKEQVLAKSKIRASKADRIDVVINNAGQMFGGLSESFTDTEFSSQLDTNVVGVHRVLRAFLPTMREQGEGLVINISSVAGRIAVPFMALYHASKWALEGYTESMRAELATMGIEFVLIQPGPFNTTLFPNSVQPADAEARAASYPQRVHSAHEGLGAAFTQMLGDTEAPNDAAIVVDGIIDIINMPEGTRPLRRAFGIDFNVGALNDAIAPFQAGVLEGAGLSEYSQLRMKQAMA